MMTIKDIVKRYLLWGGYEGLAGPDCGCEIDDLFPCDYEFMEDCEPAHKVPCDPESCPADGDCDWHMEVDDEDTAP